MEVICDRCSTQYEFEEALVSAGGTTVKCTNCGHLFKVYRNAENLARASTPSLPWTVRYADGRKVELKALREVTSRIVAGQLSADDQISHTGRAFRKLGQIPELQGYFAEAGGEPDRRQPTSATDVGDSALRSMGWNTGPIADPTATPDHAYLEEELTAPTTPKRPETEFAAARSSRAVPRDPSRRRDEAPLDPRLLQQATTAALSPFAAQPGTEPGGAASARQRPHPASADPEQVAEVASERADYSKRPLPQTAPSAKSPTGRTPNHLGLALALTAAAAAAGAGAALMTIARPADRAPDLPPAKVPEEVLAPPPANGSGTAAGGRRPSTWPYPQFEANGSKNPHAEPSHPRFTALCQAGEKALQRGDLERAQRLFGRANLLHPDLPRATTGMGYVNLRRGKFDEALALFLAGTGYDYGEAFLGLAATYQALGQPTSAIQTYRTYLRRFPQGPGAGNAKRELNALMRRSRAR